MKITKGQLKRIIAEEHALVYGAKKPKGKKRITKIQKRKLHERKQRKRELIIEANAQLFSEEIMEEGMFGDILAGLKGVMGKAGEDAMAGINKVGKFADENMKAYQKAAQDRIKKERDDKKRAAEEAALARAPELGKELFQEFEKELKIILSKGGIGEDESKAISAGYASFFQAAAPTAG